MGTNFSTTLINPLYTLDGRYTFELPLDIDDGFAGAGDLPVDCVDARIAGNAKH